VIAGAGSQGRARRSEPTQPLPGGDSRRAVRPGLRYHVDRNRGMDPMAWRTVVSTNNRGIAKKVYGEWRARMKTGSVRIMDHGTVIAIDTVPGAQIGGGAGA
jgi:hypothetical protein